MGKIDQLDLPPELKSKLGGYAGAIDKLNLSSPVSNLRIPPLDFADNIDLSLPDLKNPFSEGPPNLTTPSIPNVG